MLPPPTVDPDASTQLLVTNLQYDDYKGKIVLGRLSGGHAAARAGRSLRIDREGVLHAEKIAQVFIHEGLERIEVAEVTAGEIVALTGIPEVNIGETIADPDDPRPLPPIVVEEPTVRMTFGVNTSPLSGREGTWVTSRKMKERLERELERNVALRVAPTDAADTFLVSGRGELHLAILIETMRREGYEFQVSAPEVIMREDRTPARSSSRSRRCMSRCRRQYSGVVVEMLGGRKGQMTNMRTTPRTARSITPTWCRPAACWVSAGAFLTATRGTGIVHSIFYGYEPYRRADQRTRARVRWWRGKTATARPIPCSMPRSAAGSSWGRAWSLRRDDRGPAHDRGGSGAQRHQEEALDEPSLIRLAMNWYTWTRPSRCRWMTRWNTSPTTSWSR